MHCAAWADAFDLALFFFGGGGGGGGGLRGGTKGAFAPAAARADQTRAQWDTKRPAVCSNPRSRGCHRIVIYQGHGNTNRLPRFFSNVRSSRISTNIRDENHSTFQRWRRLMPHGGHSEQVRSCNGRARYMSSKQAHHAICHSVQAAAEEAMGMLMAYCCPRRLRVSACDLMCCWRQRGYRLGRIQVLRFSSPRIEACRGGKKKME